MKKRLLLLLASTVFALAACGNDSDTSTTSDGEATTSVIDAKKLYDQRCAMCHGFELEGLTGDDLTTIGSKYSKEEIESIILNGQGTMAGGFLKDENAAAVAEWLSEKK